MGHERLLSCWPTVAEDHNLVRFYLPRKRRARWEEIAKQTTNVGEYLTNAVRTIARVNSQLQGVIDTIDFNATTAGQRIIADDKLKELIDVLGRYRLVRDVEADILGRAYGISFEKIRRRFGQSAGEFYTPSEVATLMSYIWTPSQDEVYDPAAAREAF